MPHSYPWAVVSHVPITAKGNNPFPVTGDQKPSLAFILSFDQFPNPMRPSFTHRTPGERMSQER